jgi:hypothetical protein
MDATAKIHNATHSPELLPQTRRSKVAFRILLAFSILYFARPQDLIRALKYIPLEKIVGGLSLLALLFGLQGQKRGRKLPFEIKVLLMLLCWLLFTIPFAWWKGGAFATVVDRFSKVVIAALLVTFVVATIEELRKLLFVQAGSLILMTSLSIALYHGGRMRGSLNGIFGNPNELAFQIAINWPFALAFYLLTKNPLKKMLWAVAMFIMLCGAVLTYSRSGFLALVISSIVCLYQFGVKGHRIHLVLVAVLATILLGVCTPLLGLSSRTWLRRMGTIVSNDMEGTWDSGSKKEREELLNISLRFIVSHPFVGIGPGNFASVSGTWRVAHNSYTELGAEAGLPALLMFITLLIRARMNLKRVSRSKLFKQDMELQILTGAMWASLASYVVGAAFSQTEYHLFPYLLVAYTTVLNYLACVLPSQTRIEIKEREEEPPPELNVGGTLATSMGLPLVVRQVSRIVMTRRV